MYCLEETEKVYFNAPLCLKCEATIDKYINKQEKNLLFHRELAGYSPIEISKNVDNELREMLQEVNNKIESLKLELDGLQISVYNIGQVLSGRVTESK